MFRLCSSFPVGTVVVLVVCSASLARGEDVDFKRDVAPILEQRCWGCHGADEQESGLRLDLRPHTCCAVVIPG